MRPVPASSLRRSIGERQAHACFDLSASKREPSIKALKDWLKTTVNRGMLNIRV
jgi:hypothetical protein